ANATLKFTLHRASAMQQSRSLTTGLRCGEFQGEWHWLCRLVFLQENAGVAELYEKNASVTTRSDRHVGETAGRALLCSPFLPFPSAIKTRQIRGDGQPMF
ncbi:MAG: hypothetical protein R3C49_28285, partial [Planctomycetaceae bacterium]